MIELTTIFKAVPGQKVVNFECLNESLRFMGNDVEKIVIQNIDGGDLIIDEGDSLKEIKVQQQRGIFSFNEFPKNTVKITGSIEEIRIKNHTDFYTLHRYESHPTLPLHHINGAIITKDENVDLTKFDALIIQTDEITKLNFKDELTHIYVIADHHLKEIKISGNSVIRNLFVRDGAFITDLEINRRVLTCSILNCPSMNAIRGFGDRLIVYPKPTRPGGLSIGGFWHTIPDWYDEMISLLRLSQFDGHLSAEQINTCSDLGGIQICPQNYEGKGGQIDFSYLLGLDIEDVASGIDVKDIVELIEVKGTEALNAISSWSKQTLDWFDQYKAMRVIASLASRGYNHNEISKIRDKLMNLNSKMPKLVSGSVNNSNFGGRWRPLYSENSSEWEIPMNSIMPFSRLDLEIWLHTNQGIETLGLGEEISQTKQYYQGGIRSNRRRKITNLLAITLSAANTSGRSKNAEVKLSSLLEDLFSNSMVNDNPYCCEFLIPNLTMERLNSKSIVNALIDGISKMRSSIWVRAALLIGIVDITNSIKARMALKVLASSRDLSLEESMEINAIAVAGIRAFETGKARKPIWPYVKNWQKTYNK
tara:strand:- start:886 stop:2661 length:1776 start_codon:yes stop_codon:yes gene_type:complete